MTEGVADEVVQVNRRPGVEGLAHHGGAEIEQADDQERRLRSSGITSVKNPVGRWGRC